jgi:predicted RNA polymerase sigma factor
MIATLTRIFGLEHLTLAENVIQATLARALQTRPFCGVPKNPARWTSRVRAMDGRVRNCIVCGYNEECVGGCRI